MSYATSDFTESLLRVAIEPSEIARVVAAWGGSPEMDGGRKGWSEDSVTDWRGGFVLALKNGRYAYVNGWCDYTGWGCQDGAHVQLYDAMPELELLPVSTDPDSAYFDEFVGRESWDEEPADLNRWLEAER